MHKTTGDGWNQYSSYILVLITLLCVLKTTDEVWDPYRLVGHVMKSLFCMHKTTDESWDPYRLVILVEKALLCIQKPLMRAGTHRYLLFWSKSRCFASKNHRRGLGPIETPILVLITLFFVHKTTGHSGPKVAVLHAKTTDVGWDP